MTGTIAARRGRAAERRDRPSHPLPRSLRAGPWKVLVACECSGVVRDAFATRGWDAWSCDLKPTERPGQHFEGTILDRRIINGDWDLIIAHPDCTFLTVSANRWFKTDGWRCEAMLQALHFVKAVWRFPAAGLAIENPVGRLSTRWRPPTQIIHPWQFGEPERKATCLWLRNLPPLVPTQIVPVEDRRESVFRAPPSAHRKADRSRTFQGIADAMAEQWTAFYAESRHDA